MVPHPEFNLLDHEWIPCIDSMGKTCELGIIETLLRAGESREVYDDAPPITIALYRLLLAFLQSCWRQASLAGRTEEWEKMWRRKSFDAGAIEDYAKRHASSFNLFSETHPFYQIPRLEVEGVTMETASSIVGLELRQKNNPTLFDHNLEANPPPYTPARAARALLMGQSYATSGTGSRNASINGQEIKTPSNFEQGNLTKGAVVWLSGDNLFQTLMLNLVPHARRPDDKALWERGIEEQIELATSYRPGVVPARGPLDRLTWQSRMIRLLPEDMGGNLVVRRALVAQGRSSSEINAAEEEMNAFIRPKAKGFIPVSLSATKAAWRDSHTLFSASSVNKRPAAFDFTARYAPSFDGDETLLAHEQACRINVAGLVTDQAKILLWRHERMPAPTALLRNNDLAAALGHANEDAEFVAIEMGKRTRTVCGLFVAPDSGQTAGRKPHPDDVSRLARQLDPRRAFWPRLEPHFHQLILQLPANRLDALETWRDAVQKEAGAAFRESMQTLGGSSRAVRAAAHVSDMFFTPGRLKAYLAEKKNKERR